ncbi:hypothetical protein RND81_09G201100 [Saponaria officinalis]|uniref:HMA domain-containing protein n=1 Tax=Saponaria officinalis TaxID=3572 RepID=A0AAW1IN96_SAPOF
MSQTVVLKVKMSCGGCSGAVKRVLDKMEGVESYDINMEEQKVTVKGDVQPETVLQTVSKTGKKTELWEETTETKAAEAAETETKPTEATETETKAAETETETKAAQTETKTTETETKAAETETKATEPETKPSVAAKSETKPSEEVAAA